MDAEEVFYAKKTNIGYINQSQTLTYFDHRFADFFSCFQQIYDGSNLLSQQSTIMMHFLGFTSNSDVARRNKRIKLITKPDEYNELAISQTDPNYNLDFYGYTIPKIIPPYKLHHNKKRLELEQAVKFGQLGNRTPYPAVNHEIHNLIKSVPNGMHFFRYKKSTLNIKQQIEYDKAVMLGNHEYITHPEQIDRHTKHQQVLHELETCFPVLKPVRTTSGHQYLQFMIDIFKMLAMALRILFTMLKGTLSVAQDHVPRYSPT